MSRRFAHAGYRIRRMAYLLTRHGREKNAKRVFTLDVPAIHVFIYGHRNEDVDARGIGERKRRRSSNGWRGHDG
jgi:hypothetical protein